DDDDMAAFAAHHNGPGNDPCDAAGAPGWRADFDGDGDVDGRDYVILAHAFNGPGETPRGELTLWTGPMVTSRAKNPYYFTGRRLDVLDITDPNTPNHPTDDHAGLQIYDYRARTMDPVLGRFLQRDGVGTRVAFEWSQTGSTGPTLGDQDPVEQYGDGANLVQYANGQPTALVDPTGNWIWPQPRRTAAQCCQDAKAQGEHIDPMTGLPDLGGVICCDGEKTACVWIESRGDPSRDLAIDMVIECITRHEQDHFDDVSCGECPPTHRPPWDDPAKEKAEECKAHLISLSCLRSHRKDCAKAPNPARCLAELQIYINHNSGEVRRFCK
ncbi:MAG: hypothetical protein JXQ73_20610, partial [Phycisphaerae bacterium]|nr:hypothetical protein [Phycisphaerae bacterium]